MILTLLSSYVRCQWELTLPVNLVRWVSDSDSALRDRFASDSLAPTPLDWTEGYPQLPTSNFSINPAASSPAKISPILDYRISISIRLHLRLTSPFLSHSRQKRVRIRTKLLLFPINSALAFSFRFRVSVPTLNETFQIQMVHVQ